MGQVNRIISGKVEDVGERRHQWLHEATESFNPLLRTPLLALADALFTIYVIITIFLYITISWIVIFAVFVAIFLPFGLSASLVYAWLSDESMPLYVYIIRQTYLISFLLIPCCVLVFRKRSKDSCTLHLYWLRVLPRFVFEYVRIVLYGAYGGAIIGAVVSALPSLSPASPYLPPRETWRRRPFSPPLAFHVPSLTFLVDGLILSGLVILLLFLYCLGVRSMTDHENDDEPTESSSLLA